MSKNNKTTPPPEDAGAAGNDEAGSTPVEIEGMTSVADTGENDAEGAGSPTPRRRAATPKNRVQQPSREPKPLDILKDVLERMRRVNSDTASEDDLDVIHDALETYPFLQETIGNVAWHTLQQSTFASASTTMGRLSVEIYVEAQREALGYGQGSPLERMAIDEVLTCWLHHQRAQQDYLEVTSGSATLEKIKLFEQRLMLTQSRWMRANDALVRLRRQASATVITMPIVPRRARVEQVAFQDD